MAKFISTFTVGSNTALHLTHEEPGEGNVPMYAYADKITKALMLDKSVNPYVDAFDVMIKFLSAKVVAGESFHLIPPEKCKGAHPPLAELIRAKHHITFSIRRSLRAKICDVFPEERQMVSVPVADMDWLDFNRVIQNYYGKKGSTK